MGRAKKEVLLGEAAEIAKEYDKKIAYIRKRKEDALKRIADKQRQKEFKMAVKILDEIRDISGAANEEVVCKFVEYMNIRHDEIKEYIMPKLGDVADTTVSEIGSIVNPLEIDPNIL